MKKVAKGTDWADLGDPVKIKEFCELTESKLKGLAEKSIAHDVLEFKEIEIGEAIKDPHSDNLYMMATVPHNSEDSITMVLNMDAQPTGAFMHGSERYMIPLFRISTARYAKTVQEIKVNNISHDDITAIAYDGILQCVDQYLVSLARASVVATGQEVESDYLDKLLVTKGMKMVVDDNSFPVKMVMRKDDFFVLLRNRNINNLDLDIKGAIPYTTRTSLPSVVTVGKDQTWESLLIESMLAGNTACRVEGLRVILTHHDDILEPGEAFIFSSPDRVGRMYADAPVFEMDKRFQMVQWQADIYLGMNFGNVYSVSRILFEGAPEKSIVIPEPPRIGWFRRIINFVFRR